MGGKIPLGLVKMHVHVCVLRGSGKRGERDIRQIANCLRAGVAFCSSPPFPLLVLSTMPGAHQVHYGRMKESEPKKETS